MCKNRVKPILLNDIKTEALLVFIRTTLEQSFYQIDNDKYDFILGNNEDNEYVYVTLKRLLNHLQDTVISSSYLISLIKSSNKNNNLKLIAKKEESLMFYYESLVKAIELYLPNGSFWIPELVVISLLSEWLIEEEKPTYFYPYLNDIDYINLITKYDNCKKLLEDDKKEVIIAMYKVSSKLIETLKKAEYKLNNKNKRKKLN